MYLWVVSLIQVGLRDVDFVELTLSFFIFHIFPLSLLSNELQVAAESGVVPFSHFVTPKSIFDCYFWRARVLLVLETVVAFRYTSCCFVADCCRLCVILLPILLFFISCALLRLLELYSFHSSLRAATVVAQTLPAIFTVAGCVRYLKDRGGHRKDL